LRAEALAETVLDFAGEVLAPDGACVIKLVKGGEAVLMPRANALFATARIVRPKATRADSSEVFLVARGFKGAPASA
jgi:23S rRNA (uridine2552-2'-O)-methyltransferase